MDKKQFTTESVRVDKDIKKQVEDILVGQETIGGFYDRAASEKLERDKKKPKKFKTNYETKA